MKQLSESIIDAKVTQHFNKPKIIIKPTPYVINGTFYDEERSHNIRITLI